MQITFFVAMEETLKKALRTGIETLVSVTEEVRHGLAVLERDIQNLSENAKKNPSLQNQGKNLDALIDRSIEAIKDYENKATSLSQTIHGYLGQLDPLARQSVTELSDKLNDLAKSLKKR